MSLEQTARAWTEWFEAIGADEAIGAVALDRFAAQPPVSAPPQAGPRPTQPAIGQPPSARPPPRAPHIPPATGLGTATEIARACRTLDELERAVAAFDDCPLKATATRTVFSDGPREAPVMVIGEAPGAEEDRIGKPFVGPSGKLLDRMLEAAGLSRSRNVYITNVVFWRPPGNRAPTPAELALCLPFVRRQIALLQPKVLILSGNIAAKTLLERNDGISKFRGRWFTDRVYDGFQCNQTIATFHPSYLLRSPGQKRDAWRDILMVKMKLQEFDISLTSDSDS
jgi:uracil-DNA glycosylase family 4